MPEKINYWAIVPAAGRGARMGFSKPKQYFELHGQTIIDHTIEKLLSVALLKKIVVVLSADDQHWPATRFANHSKIMTTVGGEERVHSSLNGLLALNDVAKPEDWVLVHDAARPCVQRSDLEKLIDTLRDHPVGGLLGSRVRDTMKRTCTENKIIETVDRQELWHALTPQMFRYGLLLEALKKAVGHSAITDDASAIELLNKKPVMVEGRRDNIKITCQEDLALAAMYLESV
jgi:2-C-methyl-D-erythritol 4-phosphate cytidylyltransferase